MKCTQPDFPSLADEIAEPHPDMNIKVAPFTVSEKSSNTIVKVFLYISMPLLCGYFVYGVELRVPSSLTLISPSKRDMVIGSVSSPICVRPPILWVVCVEHIVLYSFAVISMSQRDLASRLLNLSTVSDSN